MGNDVFEVEMFDNPLQPSSPMAGAGPRAGSMSPGGSSRRRRRGRGPLPEHLEREDALAGGFTRQASDRLFAMIDQDGDGQLSLEEVKQGLERIKETTGLPGSARATFKVGCIPAAAPVRGGVKTIERSTNHPWGASIRHPPR